MGANAVRNMLEVHNTALALVGGQQHSAFDHQQQPPWLSTDLIQDGKSSQSSPGPLLRRSYCSQLFAGFINTSDLWAQLEFSDKRAIGILGHPRQATQAVVDSSAWR